MATQPSDWQDLTRDCGLVLHGSFGDFRADLPALQAEFAELDAKAEAGIRDCRANDSSWSSLDLISRAAVWGHPGLPTSGLDLMPTAAALFAREGWRMLGAHILRQPPNGVLPWHYEEQAPYSDETRLLIPLHAPPEAHTLLSHEPVAYPDGIGWVADVNFPHQVENPSKQQRIVLIADVLPDDDLRTKFPQALLHDVTQRRQLAQQTRNMVLAWRDGA